MSGISTVSEESLQKLTHEQSVVLQSNSQGKIPHDFFDAGNDIRYLVHGASQMITPLGPITTFAARNPWAGLEQQTFEQVARWLKDIHGVDMYPDTSMLMRAQSQGDINPQDLVDGLQKWLDEHSFQLAREVSEGFCLARLQSNALSVNRLTSREFIQMADKFHDLNLPPKRKHAIQTYSQRLEQQSALGLEHELNCHLIKWCKLFLDSSKAAWSLPKREEGFYRAWRGLFPYDPALDRSVRKRLKDWPKEADAALKKALLKLRIPKAKVQEYLEAHLLSLPGWAGMMLWRSQQTSQDNALMLEYLAVRISLEWALVQPCLPVKHEQSEDKSHYVASLIAEWVHDGGLSVAEWSRLNHAEQKERLVLAHNFDDLVRRRIWLEAFEKTYEAKLKEMISSNYDSIHAVSPVLVQLSFCIDVRSEPIRRKLEQSGPYETFGMAGFFGLPIETNELGHSHGHSALPVMQKPIYKIKESASESESKRYQERRQAEHTVHHTFKVMKQNLFANLLLPEVSGPLLCLQMLTKSFFPRRAGLAQSKLGQSWLRKPSTDLSLHFSGVEMALQVGISDAQKVHYVLQALNMMGLTSNFAPLVVICGHGSHSTNNPYAAALDCGACGGKSGAFNARVLAALCNLPVVREHLKKDGIFIPEGTVFVAAEHVTTTNELRFLAVPELSGTAREAFCHIQTVLHRVSHEVNEEQLARLPKTGICFDNPEAESERRAGDWSEVRPEWGLARNAAFVIGERELTKDCDLDGRVFLHNYDWRKDKDGELLSNIIAGPATVAQWINLQYYASTVAPHYYGSGNKATQTVTGGIGVMQGNASDLMLGLPWQSIMKSDEEVFHMPLRLLLVIQAPASFINRLLDGSPLFRQKVQNGWLKLVSIDAQGNWQTWS